MQIIRVEEFSEFLQQTLNFKADCYLGSLFKHFGSFFQTAKNLIEYLIDLDNLEQGRCKQLISNAISLLNLFFVEHSNFIQWSYCEHFIQTGTERITQIRANIHQIFHLFDQTKIKKCLYEVQQNIQENNTQLMQQMTQLQHEINIHQIILKQKEEQFKKFNDSIEYILIQQRKLSDDQEFKKYYPLFMKLYNLPKSLFEIQRILMLSLTNSSNLFSLLEIPMENAKQVKQIGKKNLKGNSHEIQLLMKYSQILANKNEFWNNLNKQHYEDLAECIKLLEKQTFYKQSNDPFVQQFNLAELRSLLSKKDNLTFQWQGLIKKQEQEWNTIQPLGNITLQQLSEILGVFFGNLGLFIKINSIYQVTKQEITKFFEQNFSQVVQLEFGEFDQLNI